MCGQARVQDQVQVSRCNGTWTRPRYTHRRKVSWGWALLRPQRLWKLRTLAGHMARSVATATLSEALGVGLNRRGAIHGQRADAVMEQGSVRHAADLGGGAGSRYNLRRKVRRATVRTPSPASYTTQHTNGIARRLDFDM